MSLRFVGIDPGFHNTAFALGVLLRSPAGNPRLWVRFKTHDLFPSAVGRDQYSQATADDVGIARAVTTMLRCFGLERWERWDGVYVESQFSPPHDRLQTAIHTAVAGLTPDTPYHQCAVPPQTVKAMIFRPYQREHPKLWPAKSGSSYLQNKEVARHWVEGLTAAGGGLTHHCADALATLLVGLQRWPPKGIIFPIDQLELLLPSDYPGCYWPCRIHHLTSNNPGNPGTIKVTRIGTNLIRITDSVPTTEEEEEEEEELSLDRAPNAVAM